MRQKRFSESFLAWEICEYSSKSVRFCEAKAYSSPLQRTIKKRQTFVCRFFICWRGLEPPNGTTALKKRFCESFSAGEICECKRSDRYFCFSRFFNNERVPSKSVRFCEAKAYSSPLQRTIKSDRLLSVAFLFVALICESGNRFGRLLLTKRPFVINISSPRNSCKLFRRLRRWL